MDTTTSTFDHGAFWHRSNTSRRLALSTVMLLAVLATAWTTIMGDRVAAASGPSVELEQCANGGSTCDASSPSQWRTGSLNDSNSDYVEGESVPYRALLGGLTPGSTYAVTISWKSSSDGRHTIDQLTSFGRTESGADPCAGSECTGAPVTLAIPGNPVLTIPQTGGNFALWGGTFTTAGSTVPNTGDLCGGATCTISSNPSGYSISGTLDTTSTTSIKVHFTATSTTAVMAWGGHIASQTDWGIGKSAGAVNGSSYHMYFSELECSNRDCNVGQKDRSMSTTAVTVPASITIEKSANVVGDTAFGFSGTPSPLTSFDLVDDDSTDVPDATPNFRTFSDIVDFGTYTVRESATDFWSLTNIACTVLAPNGGAQTVDGDGVVIDLREGESVSCVFSNAREARPAIELAKSASPTTYSESGEVVDYTYTVTNVGDTPIGPVQFRISDDHIDAGEAFDCGAVTTLGIGATLSCDHKYVITDQDVASGSVKNIAFAMAGLISSGPTSITIDFVAPPTTTTTTTTTTTPATTTTTTTTPETTSTTTTSPEVTTTAPATTVVEQEASTTTAPASTTTTSTTTAASTTTTPDTCVTIPREIPSTTVGSSSTVKAPAQVNDDPCVVVTTVPGTVVPAGATTTAPRSTATIVTTQLPTTGAAASSPRLMGLLVAIGALLLLVSRRRVRAVIERKPS